MEKLNELVRLAKKATQGKWHAFVSSGGGEGTFSIHTSEDSRKGDIINWPGFDTAGCSKSQKKANARYIAAANPEAILAIAEAFREMEQRARNLNDGWLNAIEERDEARAKLAELAQQKPIGWLNDAYLGRGVIDGEVGEDDFGPGYIPIYRHPFNDVPAPAADLAELLPPKKELVSDTKNLQACEWGFHLQDEGWNKAIDAILRNIEEANK